MKTAILNKDYQSELPDGSEGWLITKGTIVEILEIDEEYGALCEYIEYSFYCEPEYLNNLN